MFDFLVSEVAMVPVWVIILLPLFLALAIPGLPIYLIRWLFNL